MKIANSLTDQIVAQAANANANVMRRTNSYPQKLSTGGNHENDTRSEQDFYKWI
jgi:hypothetical protein